MLLKEYHNVYICNQHWCWKAWLRATTTSHALLQKENIRLYFLDLFSIMKGLGFIKWKNTFRCFWTQWNQQTFDTYDVWDNQCRVGLLCMNKGKCCQHPKNNEQPFHFWQTWFCQHLLRACIDYVYINFSVDFVKDLSCFLESQVKLRRPRQNVRKYN